MDTLQERKTVLLAKGVGLSPLLALSFAAPPVGDLRNERKYQRGGC